MPVSAQSQLLSSLNVAVALLDLEEGTFADPTREEDRAIVEGLRGGAAVLMVAAFEEFLKRETREILSRVGQSNDVDFAQLPAAMQIQSVFGTLQLAMSGPRYSEPPAKIERLPAIAVACELVLAKKVDPEAFAETGGNPNSDTVKETLKSVGIKNAFKSIKADFAREWTESFHETFIPEKLDEIVRRRHVVAHTADALNLTRKDLRDGVRFLRALGAAIDSCLSRHLARVVKAAAKKT